MAIENPIIVVVAAAAAVLLSLPVMFLFLAYHTHKERMSWKEEHDKAVESIDREKQRSRESPMSSRHSHSNNNSNDIDHNDISDSDRQSMHQEEQEQEQQEEQEAYDEEQPAVGRSFTPAALLRNPQRPRGPRDIAPQVEGIHFEGVRPVWGQHAGRLSQRDTRAVDGE